MYQSPPVCTRFYVFAAQFESIAGFGAIIDRLGQFAEVLEPYGSSAMMSDGTTAEATAQAAPEARINVENVNPSPAGPLLQLQSVSLRSPDGAMTLVEDLSVEVSL